MNIFLVLIGLMLISVILIINSKNKTKILNKRNIILFSIVTVILVACLPSKADRVAKNIGYNKLLEELNNGKKTRQELDDIISDYLEKKYFYPTEREVKERDAIKNKLCAKMDKDLTADKLKRQLNFEEEFEKYK